MTYIVAKPLQLLLDRVIKHDEAQPHSRAGIGLIVGDHLGPSTELDNDEVEIIQGALQLGEKRVGEIMQPIEGVFWLPNTAVLDEKPSTLLPEKDFRAYRCLIKFDVLLWRAADERHGRY